MKLPWELKMTTIMAITAAPLFWYTGRRLSTAIAGRFNITQKGAIQLVFSAIAWVYLYPIVIMLFYLSGRNMYSFFTFQPELGWQDAVLLYPFWCGLIAIAEAASYFIFLDILNWLGHWKVFAFSGQDAKPSKKEKWYKLQESLKIAIAIFCLFYVGFKVYFDTNRAQVTTHKVTIKNLPSEFNDLHICLTGDVHMNRHTTDYNMKMLKDALHSKQVDLHLFSGDLVSEGRETIPPILKIMSQPQGKIANVACIGDHDYWTDAKRTVEGMKDCGWSFLVNQHHLVSYKGKKILVTGVVLVYSWRISYEDLKKLLAEAPTADLKILLVHQPREYLVETAAAYGYHLVLGGHTHGGQIVPHFLGIQVMPGMTETPYFSGAASPYRYQDTQIIVTNGIGLTLAPIRYHAPAEITHIILNPTSAGKD